MNLSASNLVKAILSLPKGQWYEYVSPGTSTKVRVVRSDGPEGPIVVERKTGEKTAHVTLSAQMIWRIANACIPNVPFNFDRVLAGSYNTRSLLEALLAHTPEFYWCTPGRIELINNSSRIQAGHKHLVWKPETLHKNGVLAESRMESGQAISEVPMQTNTYDALVLPDKMPDREMAIETKRRHLQIQIALIEIGTRLGFRTWIAHNDKGFKYGDKKVGELEGVIGALKDERVLAAYEEAIKAANLIDCIWFKNGSLMPAVMEVEDSTHVTSGLSRMLNFQNHGPRDRDVRWVIVAADEDRAEVMRKAKVEQFRSLNTRYFPYSAVEELHNLCRRRKLNSKSVNEVFLDSFMEPCWDSVH